jgi:hypothetical protein
MENPFGLNFTKYTIPDDSTKFFEINRYLSTHFKKFPPDSFNRIKEEDKGLLLVNHICIKKYSNIGIYKSYCVFCKASLRNYFCEYCSITFAGDGKPMLYDGIDTIYINTQDTTELDRDINFQRRVWASIMVLQDFFRKCNFTHRLQAHFKYKPGSKEFQKLKTYYDDLLTSKKSTKTHIASFVT